jgi:hypothetical protein
MLYNHNANKLELMTATIAKPGFGKRYIWPTVSFNYSGKRKFSVITLPSHIDPEMLNLTNTRIYHVLL